MKKAAVVRRVSGPSLQRCMGFLCLLSFVTCTLTVYVLTSTTLWTPQERLTHSTSSYQEESVLMLLQRPLHELAQPTNSDINLQSHQLGRPRNLNHRLDTLRNRLRSVYNQWRNAPSPYVYNVSAQPLLRTRSPPELAPELVSEKSSPHVLKKFSQHAQLQRPDGSVQLPVRVEDDQQDSPPYMSGYLVADVFGEQLTRAIRTYYQLAEIASHWNVKIVEPHMSNESAGLVGLPDYNYEYFTYGDFYNVSTLYKELNECLQLGGRELVSSLENFLVYASTRQFVLLNFLKGEAYIGKGPDVFNCTTDAIENNLFALLEEKLNDYFENDGEIRDRAITVHGQQYKFKGVHAICVNGWGFSLKHVTSELASVAKKLSPSSNTTVNPLTVVIPEWREITTSRYSKTFFYRDINYSWKRSKTCHIYTIPHGQKVVRAANAFMRSLNLSHPIIGIHIRTEKLAIWQRGHKSFWQECLQSFEPAIRSVQLKYNITGGDIIGVHDQGEYGSYSIKSNKLCSKIKGDFIDALNRTGGRVVNYDPTEFWERPDRGFVSLVEKEFLSRVDYLITLGMGSYQRSVVANFLLRHPNTNSSSYTSLCNYRTT